MFQSFEAPASAPTGRNALLLRELLGRLRVDAFMVPRADEHQGEYVPDCAERLRWLTGFTGSAGISIVTTARAALFVDGRYTAQAPTQVDTSVFEIVLVPKGSPGEWLAAALLKDAIVGFDPWLHTIGEIERLRGQLEPKGIRLRALRRNPVDRLWSNDRPAPPSGQVTAHPIKFSGLATADKLAQIRTTLQQDGQGAVVLTMTDSVAWAFNIRGQDVAHNPVALAFAIIPVKGKAELFLDRSRLDPDARADLADHVRCLDPAAFIDRLQHLKSAGIRTRLDPNTAAFRLQEILGPKLIARGSDPCTLPKARKTAAEIRGTRTAHKRDGIAVSGFLAWLDTAARDGTLDEIAAVRELEARRARSNMLKEISFDTISGSGPNGAIVHYRVTDATNRRLKSGELFLIDSGGQYLDGTTDITRTVAIGTPSDEMRDRYTLVLKGHIALSRVRFPPGVTGHALDVLARAALWERGLDYDHGTGHGVGSYLGVHEGPQRIARAANSVALLPGMILSNEPGYYKEGAFGIRIENLQVVTSAERVPGGERPMHGFETLTLAPFDRRLIGIAQLTHDERAWIDAYHARVLREIRPLVPAEVGAWLVEACAPL
jgi:Xaa-Pro aminopeptidase